MRGAPSLGSTGVEDNAEVTATEFGIDTNRICKVNSEASWWVRSEGAHPTELSSNWVGNGTYSAPKLWCFAVGQVGQSGSAAEDRRPVKTATARPVMTTRSPRTSTPTYPGRADA